MLIFPSFRKILPIELFGCFKRRILTLTFCGSASLVRKRMNRKSLKTCRYCCMINYGQKDPFILQQFLNVQFFLKHNFLNTMITTKKVKRFTLILSEALTTRAETKNNFITLLSSIRGVSILTKVCTKTRSSFNLHI